MYTMRSMLYSTAPCDIGSSGACKHLLINDDLTTTCLDASAIEAFVGTGCFLRETTSLYKMCSENYNLTDTKKSLLVEKNEEE